MGRLAKLEATVAEMASDVSDLKSDVSDLKGDVSDLKGDVSDLKGDVRDLKSDVRDLKGDVRDLKAAAWRTAEILADHSERLGALQRSMDERFGAVTDRLDRLIAVTLQERTSSTERLGDIERRLTRLEERGGV